MEYQILFNDSIELSLNSNEPNNLIIKNFTGAVALDDEQKVLPLISEFISAGIQNKKLSPQTAVTYLKNLLYFHKYLKARSEFKSLKLDEHFIYVQKHIIREYLASIKGSSATKRNRDATYCSFIGDFLCNDNEYTKALRTDNPYENGGLSGRVKQKIIRYCDLEELKALMLSTMSERERTVLQTIHDAGIRRSELGRISLGDIQQAISCYNANQKKSPYVPLLINGSKGRGQEQKERLTVISIATLDRISRYHSSALYKKYARQFPDKDKCPAFFNAFGTKYNEKSISKLLERVSTRAVIIGLLHKKVSPQKLRHGCAYEILCSKDLGETYVDRLALIKSAFGHAHISTTEKYTQIPIEIYRSVSDNLEKETTKAENMAELVKETKLKITPMTLK